MNMAACDKLQPKLLIHRWLKHASNLILLVHVGTKLAVNELTPYLATENMLIACTYYMIKHVQFCTRSFSP